MFNYLRMYGAELAAFCVPGEEPRSLVKVQYMSGHEQVGSPQQEGVSFDLFEGLSVDKWNNNAEKFVGGTSLISHHGGLAITFRDVANDGPELLMTNHRIMAIVGTFGGPDMKVAWQVPLAHIGTIEHKPRIGQWGRLRFAFVDGSMIQVMAGVISGKRAREFVHTFRTLTGR